MDIDARRRRGLIAAASLALVGAGAIVRAQTRERVIPIVARKFEFVPSTITLARGEPVVLEFTAPEVTMGFACAELGVRSDLVAGQVTRVRVTPQQAGRFGFACDVFCGTGHEQMDGEIVVSG
jgi:cytochrome c oxidase subunit 2